jgi:hypothetical protein
VKLVLNTKLTNKPAYFLRSFPSTFGWNWRVAKIQQIVIKWWQLEACLFKLTTFVVIGNDCTSSCKFNYHTITTALKNMNNLMVTGTYRVAKIQQIVIKWWQLEACLVLSRPRWVKTMIKMIKCLLTRQYLFLTAVEFIYMYKYKNFNKKCWLIYNMILYVPVTIKLFIFFSAVVIVYSHTPVGVLRKYKFQSSYRI